MPDEASIPKFHVLRNCDVKTLYRFREFECLVRDGQVVVAIATEDAADEAARAVHRARLSSRDRRRAGRRRLLAWA